MKSVGRRLGGRKILGLRPKIGDWTCLMAWVLETFDNQHAKALLVSDRNLRNKLCGLTDSWTPRKLKAFLFPLFSFGSDALSWIRSNAFDPSWCLEKSVPLVPTSQLKDDAKTFIVLFYIFVFSSCELRVCFLVFVLYVLWIFLERCWKLVFFFFVYLNFGLHSHNKI